MFKNRLFNVIIAIAFLAAVGFTVRVTTTPAQVAPSSAAAAEKQMTGTYLPQAAMAAPVEPQMTGTYLPQPTINGALMTGTYLPQAAMPGAAVDSLPAVTAGTWNGGWRPGR